MKTILIVVNAPTINNPGIKIAIIPKEKINKRKTIKLAIRSYISGGRIILKTMNPTITVLTIPINMRK